MDGTFWLDAFVSIKSELYLFGEEKKREQCKVDFSGVLKSNHIL
jgi:hypothetical protein